MSKQDEYRQHAAEAFELAKRITDKVDRAVMLAVAKGWLDLAERCMHRPEAPLVDHPLVSEILGPVGGNRPSNTYRALLISIGEELKHRYEPPPELSPLLTRLVVQLEKTTDPSVLEEA